MSVTGAWRATTRGSEMGRSRRAMNSGISAAWGNAVENSALPRGKVGVTPWKSRGNPVEIWGWRSAIAAKLLAYVLHSSIVSMNFARREKGGCRQSAFSSRLRQKQWKADRD